MKLRKVILLIAGLSCFASLSAAAVLQVGPDKPYKAPCAAIAAAANGDTIEIDAGLYVGDVCAWTKDDLTIRGVGGRPHLDANGKYVQTKGMWVASGNNLVVENIEFSGVSIPPNLATNGAAIRAQGKNWTVRNCYFHDNQEGILESNVAGSNILIEYSEFARNGWPNGQSHNLYIGHVASLIFRYNYSHDSIEGHLLKTRASVNYILYNRLSQENGTGSYEINVPNGGTTYVIGNLVQQGDSTHNGTMLTFMEEATGGNPGHDLYVVNNTFVNQRSAGGTFINVDSKATRAPLIQNNIFAGRATVTRRSDAQLVSNVVVTDATQAGFVDLFNYNYRLTDASPAINAGTAPGTANGYALKPVSQYVHPAQGEPRSEVGPIDAGAYEFLDTVPPVISGMPANGCALWPVDHKFVQVATVTATDAVSGVPAGGLVVAGTSSEPADPKSPDILITPDSSGAFTVQLRAERLGTGTDRVYTLTATATDRSGNTSTSTATCTVPHDQGK